MRAMAFTVLASVCAGLPLQGQLQTIPTSNPELEFFVQAWERDPKPRPAIFGAVNLDTKARLWEIDLGGLTAVSLATP